MLEGVGIGGHAVGRGDGAERADVLGGAVVAHHPHGAHGGEHGKGLPDIVVQSDLADLVQIDRVGLAQDVVLFARDFAWHADGKPRPGKGMAGNLW